MITTVDIGSVFDRAATDFRSLGPLLWDPIGERTVAAARLQPGERVLDACCGDGASALPAARAVGEHGHVDAVDLSSAMVSALAQRAAGMPQVKGYCADVTQWQALDYDAVLCALGVFFLPDMESGTQHLLGRARPGGRLVVTIWQRDALANAGRALWSAVSRHKPGLTTPSASERVQRLGDVDTFGQWLRKLGLDEVQVQSEPLTLPATTTALWSLVVGSGLHGLLDGLDVDAVATVREEYLDRVVDRPPVDATTLVGTGRRPLHT